MTRVVIAYDMSAEADRAVDVVARAPWPHETVVRLVTSSSGIGSGWSSFAGRESRRHAEELRAALASAHERATARLSEAGLRAEAVTVGGAPARAVVNDAAEFDADLIVVGARSRSSVVAALLGSVSTEISESVPRPVLIVRVASLERVILATDGSPAADAATGIVSAWPLFARGDVRVVGVAPPPSRYVESVLSGEAVDERQAEELADPQARVATVVDAAVHRLAEGGRRASGVVRTGNIAGEIVAAANDWPADLVVVGRSGKSFVRRVVLGSVARAVLHGIHASVLIVRPDPR